MRPQRRPPAGRDFLLFSIHEVIKNIPKIIGNNVIFFIFCYLVNDYFAKVGGNRIEILVFTLYYFVYLRYEKVQPV